MLRVMHCFDETPNQERAQAVAVYMAAFAALQPRTESLVLLGAASQLARLQYTAITPAFRRKEVAGTVAKDHSPAMPMRESSISPMAQRQEIFQLLCFGVSR